MIKAVVRMQEFCKVSNQKIVYWYKNYQGRYVFKVHPISGMSPFVNRKYFFTDEEGNIVAVGRIFDEKPTLKTCSLDEDEAKQVESDIELYGNLQPETLKRVRAKTTEVKFTDHIIDEEFIKSILPASGQEMSKPIIKKINDGLFVVELFNSTPQIMEFRTDAAYDAAEIIEVNL